MNAFDLASNLRLGLDCFIPVAVKHIISRIGCTHRMVFFISLLAIAIWQMDTLILGLLALAVWMMGTFMLSKKP